jgi:MacB-like periplasmic core domain
VLGALSAHMILENARSAAYALRVNKLRSSLAMLGIIIGVGSVIATVAVGAGAHARVTEQIQSLGANLIIATAGSRTSSGVRGGQGSQVTLTEDDAIAIQRQIPAVQAAAQSRTIRPVPCAAVRAGSGSHHHPRLPPLPDAHQVAPARLEYGVQGGRAARAPAPRPSAFSGQESGARRHLAVGRDEAHRPQDRGRVPALRDSSPRATSERRARSSRRR